MDNRIVVHQVTTIIREDDLDMDVFHTDLDDMEARSMRTEQPNPDTGDGPGVYARWLQIANPTQDRPWRSRAGPGEIV